MEMTVCNVISDKGYVIFVLATIRIVEVTAHRDNILRL